MAPAKPVKKPMGLAGFMQHLKQKNNDVVKRKSFAYCFDFEKDSPASDTDCTQENTQPDAPTYIWEKQTVASQD